MAQVLKIEFLLIKDENSNCNSTVTLKNLFTTDSDIVFVDKKLLKVKELTSEYFITTDTIKNQTIERFFLFRLEKEFDEKNEETSIISLIEIFKKIKSIIYTSEIFKFVELWNDTSFYYSKLSYPLIYEVENMMRMLIYKFMLTRLGKDWNKIGFPDKLNDELKRKSSKNENPILFDDILYKFDFIHIVTFLFTAYTTDSKKIHEKISKASKISDLKLNEVKELVPCDNWTRYFEQIIKHKDFKNNWNALYDLRCKIAHNTLITKGEFDQIQKISSLLKEKIIKGIASVSKIVINKEDLPELSQSAVNAFFEPVVSDLFRMPITGSGLRSDLLFNPNSLIGSTTSSQGFIGITGTNYQLGTNANTFLGYTPTKTCVICGKLYTSNTLSITKSLDVCNECNSTGRPFVFSTKI